MLKIRHARLLILTGHKEGGLRLLEENNGKKISRSEGDLIEAQVFEQANESTEAIKRYRFVISHFAGSPDLAETQLAWILATATEASDRNPAEALMIIQRVIRRSETPPANQLDVLAAAQAATGDFASAIESATDAKLAAQKDHNMILAAQIETRLQKYTNHQPYITPPMKLLLPNTNTPRE